MNGNLDRLFIVHPQLWLLQPYRTPDLWQCPTRILPLSLFVYIAGEFIHTVYPGHLSLESWHGVVARAGNRSRDLDGSPPDRYVNRKISALSNCH